MRVSSYSDSKKWSLHGNENSEILVAGHSHAASILEYQLSLPNPDESISIAYSSNLSAGPPGDTEYWIFVDKLARDKHLVLCWNGNQHNANFLFQTSPPFTTYDLIEATADEETVVIPKLMLLAFFQESFIELENYFKNSLFASAKSVSLLIGPAPKSAQHIKSRIASEQFFLDIAKSLNTDISDLTISSENLRLNLWRLLNELQTDFAAKHGAEIIPAPESSIDTNGLLKNEFSSEDVTHANSTYGKLLVDLLRMKFRI